MTNSSIKYLTVRLKGGIRPVRNKNYVDYRLNRAVRLLQVFYIEFGIRLGDHMKG